MEGLNVIEPPDAMDIGLTGLSDNAYENSGT